MKQQYPFNAYDNYLSLRQGIGFWLVLIFIFRPYVVMLLSVANKRDKLGLIKMVYTDHSLMGLGALGAIPAMLLLYAWFKRKPDAPEHVKKIWRNGKWILLLCLIINVITAFMPILIGKTTGLNVIGMLQIFISVLFIGYIFASKRLNDAFADFPEKTEDDNKK